jgi:hypothetical protein
MRSLGCVGGRIDPKAKADWGTSMPKTRYTVIRLSLVTALTPKLTWAQAGTPASTTPPVVLPQYVPPEPWFIYTIIFIVLLAVVIALAAVGRVLGAANSKWSLSDALSEEADLTVDDGSGKPYMVNGVVVKKTELVASSSRLIAFVGTIAILLLFLGFGSFMLWDFGETGAVRSTAEIRNYLLAGLTLFAPYVVNKFSSVFAPR